MKIFPAILLLLLLSCFPGINTAQGKMNNPKKNPDMNKDIKLIELRNYLIRPGRRDEFVNYFEEQLILPQEEMGVNILGQYTVKGADDNFFWIRGFKDMSSRNKFLNDFYFGPFWKQHKALPNSLLLNNDNVYLLKPLNMHDSASANDSSFNADWFGQKKGIAVLDFFISNTKLDKLIPFVKDHYLSILHNAGIENCSFWVSETMVNDFPALPVFQDKNLLVQITFYKDEATYKDNMKLVETNMNDELKTEMADLVTIRNTMIVYPTAKSFSFESK